jgi:type IV secretion system protein VirB10
MSTCTVTKNVYSDDGRVRADRTRFADQQPVPGEPVAGAEADCSSSRPASRRRWRDVEIDSPAADALGRMGSTAMSNNHWGERIGAAMLLGITQDAIGYLATRGGNSNGSVVYENTQQQGNDMATRVLDSTINIPPTLTQNQGAEFTIVVARDLDFGTVYALQPERAP